MIPDHIRKRIRCACKLARLTPRQTEVLLMHASGYSQTAIARELEISQPTVFRHIQHAREKVSVWQYNCPPAQLSFYRALWLCLQGFVFDDDAGHFCHPATIGHSSMPEPMRDEQLRLISLRAKVFQPEDLVEWPDPSEYGQM